MSTLLPTGANGSKRLAACVFLMKTPRRAHDFPLIGAPEPRQPKPNQPTRQARAAFSLNETRCRYGAVGRFYGRPCHAGTGGGDQTPCLLWASLVQDAYALIGLRRDGPRARCAVGLGKKSCCSRLFQSTIYLLLRLSVVCNTYIAVRAFTDGAG